jgi:WD40 repeat protein
MWKMGQGKDWKCITTLDSAHERTVRGIEWNRDGSVFASSSFDATCGIWERERKMDFNQGRLAYMYRIFSFMYLIYFMWSKTIYI